MSGDGLVGGNAASPLSLALREACPLYIQYGMTYEQFWRGETGIHTAYRKAYEREMKLRNEMLWLQGRYVYDAVGALVPILSMRSKARKPEPYLEHPYDITEKDREAREEAEAKARYMKIREKVAAFAEEFNKQRKEEGNDG